MSARQVICEASRSEPGSPLAFRASLIPKVCSPQAKVSAPFPLCSSPIDFCASPSPKVSSPKKKVCTPYEKVSSPFHFSALPFQKVSLPRQKVCLPFYFSALPFGFPALPFHFLGIPFEKGCAPFPFWASPFPWGSRSFASETPFSTSKHAKPPSVGSFYTILPLQGRAVRPLTASRRARSDAPYRITPPSARRHSPSPIL